MKTLTIAVVVAMLATSAQAAGPRPNNSDNNSYEQRLKRLAEFDQARAAGGYPDPFTLLFMVLRGDDLPDNLVQPVINDPERYRLYQGRPPEAQVTE